MTVQNVSPDISNAAVTVHTNKHDSAELPLRQADVTEWFRAHTDLTHRQAAQQAEWVVDADEYSDQHGDFSCNNNRGHLRSTSISSKKSALRNSVTVNVGTVAATTEVNLTTKVIKQMRHKVLGITTKTWTEQEEFNRGATAAEAAALSQHLHREVSRLHLTSR